MTIVNKMTMEESVSPIQVIVHQPSPPSTSEIHMQLLSVPMECEGGGAGSSTSRICLDESGKPRRYSTNTPGGHKAGHTSGTSSPNVRRRSSLAAIKWSSIARRFSMGMSHDRDPPEDPAKGDIGKAAADSPGKSSHADDSPQSPAHKKSMYTRPSHSGGPIPPPPHKTPSSVVNVANDGPEPLKKKKPNFANRPKTAKIRVGLPKISAYETELEFQADAPGRVLVRLERLMGTDRIRITDPRYMTTLLRKLEEEELKDWFKRSNKRKKSEQNRFRQLAIDGYMEPGADMQDLYDHPVFRVNRILNRLSKLDDVLMTSPTNKLPRITLTEPFEDFAMTGFLFGFHKDHYLRSKTEYQHSGFRDTSEVSLATSIAEIRMNKVDRKRAQAARNKTIQAEIQRRKNLEWGGEDYEEMYEEEIPEEEEDESELEEDEHDDLDGAAILQEGTLEAAKEYYGIEDEDDLEALWTTHRSPLIDMLYDEDQDETNVMFEFSKEVLATYRREQKKTDDFCQKVHRKLFM